MLKKTRDNLISNFNIKESVLDSYDEIIEKIKPEFEKYREIEEYNNLKIINAFRKNNVSDSHFTNSTGYGYNDIGREVIEKIYADIFNAESAIVRPHFVNGTHAIGSALFGNLFMGETLYAISGTPYDTLQDVIGITNKEKTGSMRDYGINYKETSLRNSDFDFDEIEKTLLSDKTISVIHIQRSTGYGFRKALSMEKIEKVITFVKNINPKIIVFVDNCYGEFLDIIEPTDIGADITAGSLIKNIGGGITPSGGYIVGKKLYVERAANRLTVPGIGGECGATFGLPRTMLQGLFLAPNITLEAIKVSIFASAMLEHFGFEVMPKYNDKRSDIITAIKFNDEDKLIKFCQEIQKASPIDSNVTCEPWDMPGYEDQVIMAAGAFIQGSSIELSCDAPIKAPYIGYLQGSISFDHGKFAVMRALSSLI